MKTEIFSQALDWLSLSHDGSLNTPCGHANEVKTEIFIWRWSLKLSEEVIMPSLLWDVMGKQIKRLDETVSSSAGFRTL